MQTRVMVQMVISGCHFSIAMEKWMALWLLEHWRKVKLGTTAENGRFTYAEKCWNIDIKKCDAMSIVEQPDLWALNRISNN